MTGIAKCPNCAIVAKGVDMEKKFGYRISNGKRIVQSWCKFCRSGIEIREEEEPPTIDKKVWSQIKNLAKSLDDKESVINLFTDPKGLDFRYVEETLSTEGWSKNALKVVNEFDVTSTRLVEHEGLDVIYFEISSDDEKQWKKIATEILVKHGAGFSIVISHKPNSHKWIFSGSPKTDIRHAKHLPIEITHDEEISASFVNWLYKIRRQEDDTLERLKFRVNSAFDEFATEVQCALGDNVFLALGSLLGSKEKDVGRGILLEKSNGLKFDDETLKDVLNPLFTLLYRIMFVLYAESRDVFDTDNLTYYNKFSMKKIIAEYILKWEQDRSSLKFTDDYQIWKRLKGLFYLIERGSKSLNIEPEKLKMQAYGGSLFDSDLHFELEKWQIDNKSLLDAIKQLVRVQDKEKNWSFVNYASIEIRHIGTIYEKLLEFHPKIDGDKIELINDEGKKESEGTYYTPKFIVENIVENALGPIVDKIIKENSKNAQIDKILSLKILDPAMGSGHFLVEAANYLGRRIMQIDSNHDFIETKREIVRKCLYGVDLNTLAVELAKMSLWLDTLAKDHALSFLATHLKNGNSILGSTRDDMESGKYVITVGTKKKKRTLRDGQTTFGYEDYSKSKFKDFVKKYTAFETIADDDANAVKAKINDEIKTRDRDTDYDKLKYLLDIQLSKFYGKEIKNWLDLRSQIGTNEFPTSEDKVWQKVREIAEENKFFHWDLEFPQIFCDVDGNQLENPGFDIIFGNPPYGIKYDSEYFERFELGSKESYAFFMKHSLNLLKKGGTFSMVASDTWRTIRTHKPLREFLLKFKINRFIKLSRYAFKSPCGGNIDAFTIICEIEKNPSNSQSYTYYDFWGIHPLNENVYFTNLLNHAKYTTEKDDWKFDVRRAQRYKVKQKLISKCEWLPIFDGSEKLFLFLDKDAPTSEINI